MGVDAIVITSETGVKLLAKHYNLKSLDETLLFERSLAQHAAVYTSPMQKGSRRVLFVSGRVVLMANTGDLVLYIAGHGQDADEFILSQVADVIIKLLEEHLERTLTSGALQSEEALGKMYVSLDELVYEGNIENLDADVILKLSKLKAL